jgi:uncharacterized coiled-coil protein SlyX
MDARPDHRLEDRLVDLEIRYTHLERQLDELNGVVVAQQKVIDGLVKRLGDVTARVAELGAAQANDRPPHY